MNPEDPFDPTPQNPWHDPNEVKPPLPPQNQEGVTPQYNYNEQEPRFFQGQMAGMPAGNQNLPNSTGVLVLGIVAIVFCGIIGMICAIIALILASSGERTYKADPGRYSTSSYKNLKGGRICAIIALCIQAVLVVFYIIYFVVILGAAGSGAF
jgi:hypothetical protein